MKRIYTVALYDDMLARIRETVPGAAVSSDFIVGFCGETEASFEKSMRLVERSRFKNSFIFKYSPRTGTKADDLYADDVPEDVKKRRNHDLLAVQNAICREDHRRSWAGRSRSWSRGRASRRRGTSRARLRAVDGADDLRPDRRVRGARAARRPARRRRRRGGERA